jgi:molybdopterin biosynthesis enzyme
MTLLLDFAEARARVLESAVRVPEEEVELGGALGRVLAAEVRMF